MSLFDDDDPESCICPDDSSPNDNKCGEYETLRIMHKFKRFYEQKLEEIDTLGGGDCLELKLKVQQKWIEDLTEQTEMMARIVKELEDEATDRVKKLEDKLRKTSKYANEKVFYLENDVKNLLEFVRRIRDDGRWSIDGLQFYDVTHDDLFGGNKHNNDLIEGEPNIAEDSDANHTKEEQRTANEDSRAEQLRKKTEEYEMLKQTMLDMRNALTEEVACKHDMISLLRKDIQQLEERCLQADKQTAFKDDIIKELRKEIKQLKQQMNSFKSASKIKLVKHSKRTERPTCSSVIFIEDSQDEHSNFFAKKYDAKEIPTKEKSKFTLTDLCGDGVDANAL